MNINKDSLKKRIEELNEELNNCSNEKQRAFLIRSIEYKEAILNGNPESEIKKIAEEVRELKDNWLLDKSRKR